MHCDRGIVLDWVDGLCFQVVGDQKSRAYVWEGSQVLKVFDFSWIFMEICLVLVLWIRIIYHIVGFNRIISIYISRISLFEASC